MSRNKAQNPNTYTTIIMEQMTGETHFFKFPLRIVYQECNIIYQNYYLRVDPHDLTCIANFSSPRCIKKSIPRMLSTNLSALSIWIWDCLHNSKNKASAIFPLKHNMTWWCPLKVFIYLLSLHHHIPLQLHCLLNYRKL